MKITGASDLQAILSAKSLNPSPSSDLFLLNPTSSSKQPRRKSRNSHHGFAGAGVRIRRDGPPAGKRSRPETPLLRWKYNERPKQVADEDGDDNGHEVKAPAEVGRRSFRRGKEVGVSARKLAAGLWRLQLPEVEGKGVQCQPKRNQLGFHQNGVGHASKIYGAEAKDLMQSPRSVSGPINGFLCKHEPLLQFANSAMEGATKWDPVGAKISDQVDRIYGQSKPLDEQIGALSVITALKVELEQAQSRIHELETERRSSKKKLEHFLKKLSDERATWRSREHEKVRAIINDVKSDLNRERKSRQKIEMVNSKLVNELADTKLAAKRFMQDYEKEREARELIEEVCEELAKEVGEDKAEVEALRRESMKFREDVEEERKMLQMAEVWREERVQMKLVDAKVALEEKYSHMNKLVEALETFLSSRGATPDMEQMRKAEFLRKAAALVNIREIEEFTYDPPNPDDIFAVFEDVNFGENHEREIEPCVAFSPASHSSKIHTVSPEVNMFNKDGFQRHSNASYLYQNGDVEEDESGWETVSQAEDQGSNYSPEGSDPSVNKIQRVGRVSNGSGSGTDWEGNADETPITEIGEVCSVPKMQLKKVSSISRLWRSHPNNNGESCKVISVEGVNGRLSNGGLSNGAVISPDRDSVNKGGLSPSDLVGQWSSPESGNPHITRGMKGCLERRRGTVKNSLKAKLLEARMESQKSQKVPLRQVLKQRI